MDVVGTLAAMVRCHITDFLDDDGRFDIKRVKQARLGHLLKGLIYNKRGFI
jgi:hypothetical protein